MQSLVLSILILLGFLASNCQPSESQSRKSDLILAVKKCKFERVRYLLAREGADPDTKDKFGTPALHWACDLDKTGKITKLLLDKGAKIDVKGQHDCIALDVAEKASNTYAIKQLIQKAIDLKMLNLENKNGETLLHYAVALHDGENTKTLEQLLRLPLDVNSKDHYGCTPLHYATRNKDINIKVVKKLLKEGASVRVKDNDLYTPLDYAQCTGRKDVIVQLLLCINPNRIASKP